MQTENQNPRFSALVPLACLNSGPRDKRGNLRFLGILVVFSGSQKRLPAACLRLSGPSGQEQKTAGVLALDPLVPGISGKHTGQAQNPGLSRSSPLRGEPPCSDEPAFTRRGTPAA